MLELGTGVSINLMQTGALLLVLLLAGAAAGFVAGLFGIGGGFVVVPTLLLVFGVFGFDPELTAHMAVGTSLATIIITSIRSVQAHHKRGAVDWDILKDWLPWLTLGVVIGLGLAGYMDARGLKWIFSAGVFLMGLHFIWPVLQPKVIIERPMPKGPIQRFLAIFLGGFSALLGIGGGTIAVLAMTHYGRAMHRAVATAAGFGVIIAVPGTIGFVAIGLGKEGLPFSSLGYINLLATLALTLTSFWTAPLGAKAAHALNGAMLKKYFGIYLVLTSAIVLWDSLPK